MIRSFLMVLGDDPAGLGCDLVAVGGVIGARLRRPATPASEGQPALVGDDTGNPTRALPRREQESHATHQVLGDSDSSVKNF